MKYNTIWYSLKVWLSSALITPAVVMLILITLGKWLKTTEQATNQSFLYSYLYLVVLFLIGTLPPWVAMQIFAGYIVNSSISLSLKKAFLCLGVVLMFIVIMAIGGSGSHYSNILLAIQGVLAYIIAIALCAWFYKLAPVSYSSANK